MAKAALPSLNGATINYPSRACKLWCICGTAKLLAAMTSLAVAQAFQSLPPYTLTSPKAKLTYFRARPASFKARLTPF